MQICQRAPSLPPRSPLVDKCFPHHHDDDGDDDGDNDNDNGDGDDDGSDNDNFDDGDDDIGLFKCHVVGDVHKVVINNRTRKCPTFPW